MSSVNTFSSTPERNWAVVESIINTSNLISLIQADYTDPYFNNSTYFNEVDVYYTHEAGRHKKRIKHTYTESGIKGNAFWSTYAKSGIWQVTKVRSIDFDGAEHTLERDAIGSDSDIIIA
jgi:hypothetical protein